MKNTTNGLIANAAIFQAGGSTGAIRFRDDGIAPTTVIGMRIPANTLPYFYQGDLHRLQFIADSTAGNADVQITYVLAND